MRGATTTTGEVDHRALLAALPDAEREALTRRRNAPGLRRLGAHAAAIAATGGLLQIGTPLWPLVLVVHGVVLIFLFTALHESLHGTAFRSAWLNAAVARACGFAIVMPTAWFRYYHLAHHRYTQDPERDPELSEPRPATLRQYLLYLSGVPAWRSQLGALARYALGRERDAFVPQGAHARVVREARTFVAGYAIVLVASLALRTDVLLWTWLLPLLVGQPFLRAYLLAEHGGCPFVANMLHNSRTTFTSRLVRLLAWNMPYHAEHHACPAVPFHQLPALHRHARPHLAVTENGYPRFHRSFLRELRGH